MRQVEHNPDRGEVSGDLESLRALLPYLWPRDNFGLRARVALSMGLLGLAKITTVAVPVILKYAVDALSAPAPGEAISPETPMVCASVSLFP